MIKQRKEATVQESRKIKTAIQTDKACGAKALSKETKRKKKKKQRRNRRRVPNP
jgi:hypothetical protein